MTEPNPATVADELKEAIDRVEWHMQTYYRTSLSDLEISDVPGYWRDKEPKMHPGHPLHSCLFCDGPFKASYRYLDPAYVRGRFSSPYKSWRIIKKASEGMRT